MPVKRQSPKWEHYYCLLTLFYKIVDHVTIISDCIDEQVDLGLHYLLIYADIVYMEQGLGEVTAPGLFSILMLANVLNYVPWELIYQEFERE